MLILSAAGPPTILVMKPVAIIFVIEDLGRHDLPFGGTTSAASLMGSMVLGVLVATIAARILRRPPEAQPDGTEPGSAVAPS